MDPVSSLVPAVQQITTNLRVPGGIPGAGLATFGLPGANFGVFDTPINMLSRLILRQDAFIPTTKKKDVKPPQRGRIDTERTNINGVKQKGTVLSPMAGANQMLENLGVTTQRYGKFQSNNLPGSNYSPEVEKALSKIYDTETLHRFDGSVDDLELSGDLFMDGSGVKGDGPFYTPDVNYDEINPINMLQAEGSPFLVRNGGFSATDQLNPQNKNGTRARYDQEFLNSGNDVIGGLRAADASKGLLYASGKYWRENPNAGQKGEKDYIEIHKDKYKAIKNSDMGAQDFLSSKLEQTKQTFKPDLTGQSDSVRDAVGLTADPYTFTAEGPSDERSTRLAEYMLGKIDDINPKPTPRR